MAMATFDLFYNNHDLFVKNGSKIRRGLAVKLIQVRFYVDLGIFSLIRRTLQILKMSRIYILNMRRESASRHARIWETIR